MGIDGEKIVGVNEGKNPHHPFDEPDPTGPSLVRKICGKCVQKQENREEKRNLNPQDRFHIKKQHNYKFSNSNRNWSEINFSNTIMLVFYFNRKIISLWLVESDFNFEHVRITWWTYISSFLPLQRTCLVSLTKSNICWKWKVVAEWKDTGILGLQRRIQSEARDEAGSLRAFV